MGLRMTGAYLYDDMLLDEVPEWPDWVGVDAYSARYYKSRIGTTVFYLYLGKNSGRVELCCRSPQPGWHTGRRHWPTARTQQGIRTEHHQTSTIHTGRYEDWESVLKHGREIRARLPAHAAELIL